MSTEDRRRAIVDLLVERGSAARDDLAARAGLALPVAGPEEMAWAA